MIGCYLIVTKVARGYQTRKNKVQTQLPLVILALPIHPHIKQNMSFANDFQNYIKVKLRSNLRQVR